MSTMTLNPVCSPRRVAESRRPAVRSSASVPVGSPVRVTARGRALLLGLVLLVLVTSAVLLTGTGTARAGFDRPPGSHAGAPALTSGARVTVRPGETVWQIAQRIAPGADPRETVADLLRVNALQTADVRPGMALLLP